MANVHSISELSQNSNPSRPNLMNNPNQSQASLSQIQILSNFSINFQIVIFFLQFERYKIQSLPVMKTFVIFSNFPVVQRFH